MCILFANTFVDKYMSYQINRKIVSRFKKKNKRSLGTSIVHQIQIQRRIECNFSENFPLPWF